MKLASLPNIGRILADQLNKAGITTADELFRIGSRKAFLRIAEKEKDVCITMLYSLEGAVQGVRRHNIDQLRKEELKKFYFEWQLSRYSE
jgi:DNA transformation protein and related proteins